MNLFKKSGKKNKIKKCFVLSYICYCFQMLPLRREYFFVNTRNKILKNNKNSSSCEFQTSTFIYTMTICISD